MTECVVLQGCIPVSWPAHFMFLLHRSCISSRIELGLVVEPISLCIHETLSLRESVWLCATLGISVKGLHLQCLWCSQLFALFCKGVGGSHCGTWQSAASSLQLHKPGVTARARIMSLLNLRRYRWPQKKGNFDGLAESCPSNWFFDMNSVNKMIHHSWSRKVMAAY